MSGALRCLRCGSESVIAGCRVWGEGRLTVAVPHPNRAEWMDPVFVESPASKADVCGACGFVMLLADEPQRLHDFWVKNGGPKKPRQG
jgi:ribosomal protein L37E